MVWNFEMPPCNSPHTMNHFGIAAEDATERDAKKIFARILIINLLDFREKYEFLLPQKHFSASGILKSLNIHD